MRLRALRTLTLTLTLTPNTLTRCVYELASFCKKNPGEALVRMHEPNPSPSPSPNPSSNPNPNPDPYPNPNPDQHERLMLVSLDWPSSLSPASSPKLTGTEREVLARFRCREAECFKPCDRATVLAAVRNDWGSEEAFDTFVQNDLVKVLEESKTRYSTWLAQVISDTLELMFGN